MRIGHGFDIHRFEDETTKDHIILGGVSISHHKGIVAHSDGDVVVHALIDALLGATALGDIGLHFPDSDPRYKNIDSREMLKKVVNLLAKHSFKMVNADITIIAEEPKLCKHIPLMREYLACDLESSVNDINIKATTHEKVDAVGQCRALSVHAVVLVD